MKIKKPRKNCRADILLNGALTDYEYKFAAGITMENLDLNTYTTIGFYQSKSNIGYTNAPSSGRDANFNLRVEYVLVDHYIIQTLQSYIDGRIFTRGTYYSSGGLAWSSWEEVATKSDLTNLITFYDISVTSDEWGNGQTWLSLNNRIPIFAQDQTGANNQLGIWVIPNDDVIRISGLPSNVTHTIRVYCIIH